MSTSLSGSQTVFITLPARKSWEGKSQQQNSKLTAIFLAKTCMFILF